MKNNINKIITESINKVLNEKFNSNTLRGLYNSSPSYKSVHGLNNFAYKNNPMDMEANGVISKDGLYLSKSLDKITDDMIEFAGTLPELVNNGYNVQDNKVVDYNGNKHYAIEIKDGRFVVFKNDPETIQKMKELSTVSGKQYKAREVNRMNDGKNDYQWSTKDRGTAFRDWKQTSGLWDDESWQRKYNIPKDWRNKETWLGNNMKKALDSYKKK